MRTFIALVFATLMAGCYESGWRYPGYPYPLPANGEGMINQRNPNLYWACDSQGHHCHWAPRYTGYSAYPEPGLFGGYPPARKAWDESTRGRVSYGDGMTRPRGGHDEGGVHPGSAGGKHEAAGGDHDSGGRPDHAH